MSPSDSDGLTPDPRSSALGDLTDSIRSRARDVGAWVGDFGGGWRVDARDRVNAGGYRASTNRRGERAEQIEPPRDAYDTFRQQYDTTPLISAPIDQMASDVTADGWRVVADDERTQEFLSQWGEQAAIVAGEPDKDFIELVSLWSKVYDIYGDPITENVPALERPDAVAALKMVPPSTISYHTLPGSEMLLQPGHTDHATHTTERGTAAAYTQYSKDADEIWTDGKGRRLDPRHFDFEQVTRAVRNPDPGSVTGKSAIEQISEQVETLKNHFRNDETAIESSAWKQLFVGYQPAIHDLKEAGVEIDELSEAAKDEFEYNIEQGEPGEVHTFDGGMIDVTDVAGEVADIVDRYQFFVDYILSAMPAPKYAVGWESDINQFVTEVQERAHEQQVKQRKQMVSRTFTPIFRRVADQHAYDPSGVEIKLEAPPQDSPVLSLDDATIDRIDTFADAMKKLAGSASPTTMVDEQAIVEQVLQMDYDDVKLEQDADVADLDEQDPEVRRQAAILNGDGAGEESADD